jgi:hypothetical protein
VGLLSDATIVTNEILDPSIRGGPPRPEAPLLGAGRPQYYGDLLLLAANLRYFDHPAPEAHVPRAYLLEAPRDAWLHPANGPWRPLGLPIQPPPPPPAPLEGQPGAGSSPRDFLLAAILTDGSTEHEKGLVWAAFGGLPQSAPSPVLVARFAAWRSVGILRKFYAPLQERTWQHILRAVRAEASAEQARRSREWVPRAKPPPKPPPAVRGLSS